MDTPESVKKTKPVNNSGSSFALRVRRETKRRVMQECAKANKKDFGRKITVDDLIALAVSLLNAGHLAALQDRSLSNADRLEQLYREHVKKHGPTTKDTFLGQLIGGGPAASVPLNPPSTAPKNMPKRSEKTDEMIEQHGGKDAGGLI